MGRRLEYLLYRLGIYVVVFVAILFLYLFRIEGLETVESKIAVIVIASLLFWVILIFFLKRRQAKSSIQDAGGDKTATRRTIHNTTTRA